MAASQLTLLGSEVCVNPVFTLVHTRMSEWQRKGSPQVQPGVSQPPPLFSPMSFHREARE